MKLPLLTAEASLYQSDTYYRTNARTSIVRSSRRRIQQQDDGSQDGGTNGGDGSDGGEIINVHGNAPIQCPTGYEQVGNTCALIDSGSITPPGTVATSGGSRTRNPRPKPGHGPKRPNPKATGNGFNGGDYNPASNTPCCSDSSLSGDGSDPTPGSYVLNPGGNAYGWACCHQNGVCDYCNSKNGKSTVCEDGGCGINV
jgi:hypothetical protein